MAESDLQAKAIELLHRLGHWPLRINSGRVPTRNGWFSGAEEGTPDVLCMFADGTYGWFEFKDGDARTKKRTAEAQRKWREKAEKRGIRVAKVRSLDELIEVLVRWSLDG